MNEELAERLIDLAARGERVPNEMCEGALVCKRRLDTTFNIRS
jgi:hypothetical protein